MLIRANITDISLNLSQVNISKPDGTSELRNLTLNSSPFFETNYSTSLPGIYTFTIIARDTNGNVNGTEMGYFIIGTPPLVIIIAPINETFDDDTKVFITVNASDIDNISTLFANITLPNGTSTLQPVNRSDMTNDSFDSSSRWIPNTESTALGQNCSVDINTTVAGQMNLRINGTGTGVSSTICGFSSTEFIEGDFNATISWNSTIGLGPDSRLLIEFLESTASLATDPREIEIIYKKISNGSTYYVAEYNENGTEVKIAEVQTADTYGQFLITRIENNFTWHTFNNTDQTFDLLATAAEVNVSRGLFTHIEVQSRPPSFASLNVTWDDLTIFSDPYPFIAFNQTTQNGTYAITILANDTFGARNDSTTTHFVITSVNDPPTNPEITLPQPGTFIRGTFNISWDAVTDLDNDQLQYNITLLNPDLSFNASIVNKTGNTSTVFYLWDSTQYPDGVYNLRVTVFENETVDGLSASDTVDSNFTIDNTRPLVRNLTPTNGTFFNLSDTVTITANITDLNGIDRRLLQALLPNGTLLDFNMSPAGGDLYQFNYTITDVVGNYTMFVVANDSASNENLDIEGNFFVRDNIGPRVTNLSPTNGTQFNTNSTIEISATIVDNVNVSNASINITLPNGSILFVPLNNFSTKHNTSFTILNLTGNYTVRFFANDTNGNINSTETLRFVVSAVVDNTPPSVINLTPINGTTFLINDTVNITVNVSDFEGSGDISNVTDNNTITSVIATIIKPDGLVETVNLSNISGNIFAGNFSNLTLKNNYTIIINATDAFGNVNNTVTSYFTRVLQANTFLDVIDPNETLVNYTQTLLANVSGLLDVELNFSGLEIPRMVVLGFNASSPRSVLGLANSTIDDLLFANTFAIDPLALDMRVINVTYITRGVRLYKCANFSFANITCNDGYELLLNTTVGQTVTFLVNSTDPGFGDQNPDNGTPDDGAVEAFQDGFSSIVNSFSETQADDQVYFAVRRDNVGGASLDAVHFAEIIRLA